MLMVYDVIFYLEGGFGILVWEDGWCLWMCVVVLVVVVYGNSCVVDFCCVFFVFDGEMVFSMYGVFMVLFGGSVMLVVVFGCIFFFGWMWVYKGFDVFVDVIDLLVWWGIFYEVIVVGCGFEMMWFGVCMVVMFIVEMIDVYILFVEIGWLF